MCSSQALLFVVALCCGSVLVNGQTPQNVALVAGGSAEFRFVRPVGMQAVNWYTHVTGAKQILFFNGSYSYSGSGSIGNRSSTTITANDTHVLHTLYISNVEMADGGQYNTEDILAVGSTVEVFMEMIVLERGLDCIPSPDPAQSGYEFSVTCTLPYHGRWGAVVTCNSTRIDGPGITDISAESISIYYYNGTALKGVPTDTVTCEAHYELPTIEEYTNMALNIPDYTSTWSKTLNVYYPATTISVSSNLTEHDVGDTITCLATGGNPAPTYKWVDENTLIDMSATNILTLTDDMADQYFNATCFAITMISGLEYELLVMIGIYVKPLPITTTTTTTTTTPVPGTTTISDKRKVDDKLLVIIIVATVASLLGLGLIITLVVCCVKKVIKSFDSGREKENANDTRYQTRPPPASTEPHPEL